MLQSGTYRGGAYEIPFLIIVGADQGGCSYFADMFADDDPAAWERLEELAAHHGISDRGQDAVNRGDFDALRELVAEDFRQEDLRPLGGDPVVGREAYLAMLADIRASAPDTRLLLEVFDVAGDHRITRQRWAGRSRDGGPWEVELWTVNTLRDGRSLRAEIHESEDAARARLEELAGDAAEPPVVVAYEGMTAACNRRDWEALAGFVAADMRWSDHRPGLRGEARDRESFVEVCRSFVGRTDVLWSRATLETRGPHLLSRVSYTGTYRGGPFEVIAFDVITGTPDGRLATLDLYAEDQLDLARAAYAELTGADQ